jgi:hypothetical protein
MKTFVLLAIALLVSSQSWSRPYLGEAGHVASLPWKMYVTTGDRTRILRSFSTAEECWMAEDIAEAVKEDIGVKHESYLIVCSQTWTKGQINSPA